MSRLALLVVLLGCGGGAASTRAPAPAPVAVAEPPPPAAPVVTQPEPEPEQPPDQVALGETDPCMGGEATGGLGVRGAGPGGGGTGEGTIGIGSIGTSGRGTGTGVGYGRGGMRGGSPSPLRFGTPTVSGPLDKAIIRRIVRRHMIQIRYCYEKQLTKTPKLEGQVTATWTITVEGAVEHATASGLHAEVDACIANRIKTWLFPKPKAGVVTVSYPFAFKAAE
jgi:hypothetical protein